MYVVVLVTHSWLRWAVLVLGTLVLAAATARWISGGAWSARLERAAMLFVRALDIQVALGLLLYLVLSPLARSAWSDFGAAMADPVLRFYGVEHLFGMLVAVGLAHVGFARVRKMEREEERPRALALVMLAWLVITVVSVPWPGLAHGRPLFRI